jgi:hypothetical protein
MKKLITAFQYLMYINKSTKLKILFLFLLVSIATNFIASQSTEVEAQVTGGPICSRWRADFYGMNDTATIRAGYSPYGNPGIGYTGPSREQVQVSAGISASPALSCAQPTTIPRTIITNNCAAGSSSCPTAPQQFGGALDADRVWMSPQGSVTDMYGATLTYIGTSYEAGTAGFAQITNGRNFPTNAQVGSLNRSFRLIFHYVNCADPIVATSSYCPPPPPSCSLSATPSTITSPQQSTLNWSYSNATLASIDQGIGVVGTPGSRLVAPSVNTTYRLNVSGPGGSRTCSRPVTVTVATPAVTCTLNASASSINSGDSVTLTWTTGNSPTSVIKTVTPPTAVTATTGTTTGGSDTYRPTANTTFRYEFSRSGYTNGVCTASVSVVVPPVPPPGAPRRLGPWDSIINLPPVL